MTWQDEMASPTSWHAKKSKEESLWIIERCRFNLFAFPLLARRSWNHFHHQQQYLCHKHHKSHYSSYVTCRCRVFPNEQQIFTSSSSQLEFITQQQSRRWWRDEITRTEWKETSTGIKTKRGRRVDIVTNQISINRAMKNEKLLSVCWRNFPFWRNKIYVD